MVTNSEFNLVKEVLISYENAYVVDHQRSDDIREALCWDSKENCFTMDWGYALRGEAESFRVYKGVEDYVLNHRKEYNQYDASVVYGKEVYFFEIVEPA